MRRDEKVFAEMPQIYKSKVLHKKKAREKERAVDHLISMLSGTRPWQSSLRVRVRVACWATLCARHEKVQARLGRKRGDAGERRSRLHGLVLG